MREKQQCVVVTFYTTAEAMATKKLCKEKHIQGKMISAPRALSADCGIAWCTGRENGRIMEQALIEAEIEYAGIHEMIV